MVGIRKHLEANLPPALILSTPKETLHFGSHVTMVKQASKDMFGPAGGDVCTIQLNLEGADLKVNLAFAGGSTTARYGVATSVNVIGADIAKRVSNSTRSLWDV